MTKTVQNPRQAKSNKQVTVPAKKARKKDQIPAIESPTGRKDDAPNYSPGTAAAPMPTPARINKQALIIEQLKRVGGVTIDELAAATGWQRHSVRGVISGALKKRLGLAVTSSQEDRGRVYRIAVGPDAQ